jgi:DNA-binding beta-propeller fold protein YncE
VLSLRRGWAYCADLPRTLWGQAAGTQAMVTSPDGRALYIVDPARGVVSRMDTRTLKVTQTRHLDLGVSPASSSEAGGSASVSRASASISPDGSTLYVATAGENAIVAVDARTMNVLGRWTMPAGVSDLALSADGARLYAATSDEVTEIDPATGLTRATISTPGVQSIVHIGSPAS